MGFKNSLMRLKKLTLCLLGLSLSACSTVMHNNQSTAVSGLDQKAAQGLNAMYTSPSYDFNGQFKFGFSPTTAVQTKPTAKTEKATLDPALVKQVDAYLRAQKIKVTAQQKAELYQAIEQENSPYYSGSSKKTQDFLSNILSNIDFSYDGSVHFRDKIGSFNLTSTYEKPNLLVQSKIPMVLDFKNHKFYINYFGFMPFMVNPENQNDFAYFDFSAFKDDIDQVNLKNFVEYIKQNSTLPYSLAQGQQLHSLKLSSQEQAQGVVEKIRLQTSLEEMILQNSLFEAVNKTYMQHSVVNIEKIVESKLDKAKQAGAENETDLDDEDRYMTYGMGKQEAEAYRASKKLYRLVNEHLYGRDDDEDDAVAAATEAYAEAVDAEDAYAGSADAAKEATADAAVAVGNEAVDAAADATEARSAADEAMDAARAAAEDGVDAAEEGMNYTQCKALKTSTARIRLGDVTYCQDQYDINVLSPAEAASSPSPFAMIISDEYKQLEETFAGYATENLVGAADFKVLWDRHQTEIKALLAKHSHNQFVTDVGLDAQGRAMLVDYQFDFDVDDFGKIHLTSGTRIFNYGKATPISRSQFKNAKSAQEITKGSMFESFISGITRSLGTAGGAAASTESGERVKSLDAQLDDLAAQIYDSSRSYSSTYEAVFIMKMTAEQPEVVKYYTSQELSEIARVYAFSYADQDLYNPQGAALASLEKLMDKHQLHNRQQYDNDMGSDVYDIVEEAIAKREQRQSWNQFAQKYKQPKDLFAAYYVKTFAEEHELDQAELAALRGVANILAQAYVDTRNNKLSAKTIAALKEDADEYIDYDLYRQSYEKVQKRFK